MVGIYTAIVVIAAYSANEQHKASVEQHRAAKQERRMAAAQNLRERKQAYRQMLVQQAQLQAAATNLGASQSSGAQGGIASIGTQTASNIGFQGQIEASNQQRLSFLDKAAQHTGKAQVANTIGGAIKPAYNAYQSFQVG
jgi:hypothetical protein